MKFIVIAALLASSASAFVSQSSSPSSKSALSVTVGSKFEKEIGVQAPLGFWDPMFVLEKNPDDFARFREQEIKHGRVAMLAVTGYLTTAAGVRFPGAEAVPAGFKAFSTLYNNEVEGGLNVLMQFMFTTLLMEIVNGDRTGKGEFPGDYRNGALDFGWNKQSEAWQTKKRATELNQGRAAMMGITGLMIHEWMGVSILPGGYLP